MRKMLKSCIVKVLSLLMTASVLLAAPITAGAFEASENTRNSAASQSTIKVSAAEIDLNGAYNAIQGALDIAKNNATADNVYKVIVEKGEYVIGRSLKIYSNTYLSLTGVTLVRDSSCAANIIRTGSNDSADTGVTGYRAYTNITIDGGTLDGSCTRNTIIKFAHATNITLINQTLKNVDNGHIMEVAGVDGLTIKNCDFSNQVLTPSSSLEGYEAIQLDVLVQSHFPGYRSEDIPMKNVLIEECSFSECPRGIGSHTAILNNPFDGIKIKNCTFNNMSSVAIQGLNWINCEITGNKIDNAPRGIAVYSVMNEGKGVYNASYLASEGKTTAHVTDKYTENKNQNILIADNELSRCGYINDKYAVYESGGIFAIGYDIPKVYAQNSKDHSGGIAKGNYYISGVTVRDNIIDVKGHGVRFVDTRASSVKSNTILCSENTLNKANYHGIQVLEGKADLISGNSIKNSSVNGIYVYKNSNVTEISNNTVKNSNNYGISVDNAVAGKIYNNIIDSTASNGIHASHGGSIREINGNTINNAGNHGISITSGSSAANAGNIINNTVYKALSNGINVSSGAGAGDIKGNFLSYSGNHGISVTGASSAGTISENVIFGSGGKMVNVSGDSKATVGANSSSIDALSITLNKTSITLGEGENYTLTETVTPSNTTSTIVWSSSNAGVATVDQTGKVTARATGTAKITVKTDNGKTASCAVTVKKAPTSIALNATSLTLGIGETFDLNSSLSNGEGAYHITYSSDNPSVASVKSAGGLVTAVSAGEATITATTYNGVTTNCKVKVKTPLIYGDLNRDGKVNLRDAIEIQKISLSMIELNEDKSKCGDVDKNGRVNLLDSIYVQKYAANMNPGISGIGEIIPAA
ncbi:MULTISPECIES: Ig-like domain-containing protein [unclassified Ruminococcus]|uniref:Ig-like domain-containing protein n=1 Tax=unclassified Ruminococcus TaxID=2608920 RepID=UPI00210E0215|nr:MULTISPECIES: Ig-like domain-containing protein [unclassified Ruminococcus]MCQ4021478.1 hypothetical protein [Ruminococcus sp. zg-924]MCQ4113923.1 hypothetical protein [Ruminococcus sp. zg-921]